MSSPLTKALLLQYDIDEANLCQNWSLGRYEYESQLKAQGQAQYIAENREVIREMWREDDD